MILLPFSFEIMALDNAPVVLTITEKLQEKMVLCEPQIKNSTKKASADVWGYVKSRGEKYALQVVQVFIQIVFVRIKIVKLRSEI